MASLEVVCFDDDLPEVTDSTGILLVYSSETCSWSVPAMSLHFIVLPVRFSMSTPETVAPKSILEPSGHFRGVTIAEVILALHVMPEWSCGGEVARLEL